MRRKVLLPMSMAHMAALAAVGEAARSAIVSADSVVEQQCIL
jgi:hypothetical protein